jgi:hypothetical protein
MKTLTFYEVNEATSSRALFDRFPPGEKAREVFDLINNRGAVTLKQLRLELPDFSGMDLSSALTDLRRYDLITRRTLSAHEED